MVTKLTTGQIILWTSIGIVALVLLVFVYALIRNRIIRHKPMQIFSNIFSGNNFPLPKLLFGYSYWWPIFKITFDSLAAFENAQQQGLLAKFEQEISVLYGPEFDPTRAITYLYLNKSDN